MRATWAARPGYALEQESQMKRKCAVRRHGFVLLPLFLLLACVGAFAQANSSVTGIVSDQSGALISGATIALTDVATGSAHTTVTSDTGLYTISGLNASTYNMRVTAKGFQNYSKDGIVVNISATFREDVTLAIGADTQTIVVQANALAVQADSNVVSTLINEEQITELATNGRNVVALAALGLGVSGALPDSNLPTSVGSSFAISFNGLNQAHNIWILDGGEAYDRGSGGKMSVMPSQDALGEFQVLSSNYPPDYGISSGGTVTMSIKRGSQQFHGESWEFDRNDALDAHRYFDNNHGQLTPKSELRYNVFGANLGGPLFIPHVYNESRKKTFFFYNEEWRRIVQGQSPNPINTVPEGDNPTSAADFTYVLPAFNNKAQLALPVGQQIFVPIVADPAFNSKLAADNLVPGTPFPGNRIPGNLLDPNALLFNATRNIPATGNANSTFTPPTGKLPTMVREDLFRIDHSFNDKWQIFAHFMHDAVSQNYAVVLWGSDSYPSVGSQFVNPSYSSVVKLTGTISPNMLLEAAFNYDGNKIYIAPVAAGGASFVQPTGWTAQSYFPAANNAMNRIPNIALTTFGTTWGANNDPWRNGAEDYNEIASLSWTRGRHAMKFGGGYNRYTKNQINGSQTEGTYTFNDGWAGTAPSGTLTGDSYLDFELGLATQFAQSQTDPIFHYVNNTVSAYAEDDWHLNNRLSIQYGIRYDALPHVWERTNALSNFDPAHYQTALAPEFSSNGSFAPDSPGLETVNGTAFYMNGMDIAGQDGTPRGIVRNDWKTYQPRIGFSYDPIGNNKTVVRGGFGTFYERMQGNDIYGIAGGAPFVNTPTASDVELTNTSYNWQSGGAASTPRFAQAPGSLATYYPAPAVAQYSLGVQHELAPSLILVTQYVGNTAWHQNINLPFNNFLLTTPMATRQASAAGTLSTVDTLNARAYPGYTAFTQTTNLLTGNYNSFQAGLRQQNRFGLSFEVDYTWSHEIDDQLGSVDLTTLSNPWNLKYDKGSGNLDRRQMLNANYTYKVPIFAHSGGLTHSLLGGWELSGVIVSESGLPWAGLNAPAGGYADTVGLGGGYTNRANFAGKVRYTKAKATVGSNTGYQWVASDGFSAPVASWLGGPDLGFGNSGRDIVVGPGRSNFTTSLYKSFAVSERARFELRADSFNTFNHTQFSAFNQNVSAANFGFTTATQDPRDFQFGGKFIF
jgi:Carboxypeptidase regulatory-like domain